MPIFNFIPACVLMAICVHGDLNDSPFFDVMWTIGLNLDTIAMLPQLWLLTKLGGNVEALTSHFVALQVLSRCCSFAFWFYGYVEITPEHQFNAAGYMIIVAHLAQLLLSADFMYYYVKIYYENKQEMIIRRNDLAVFEFMLKLTKCKAEGAFMQVEKHTNTPDVNMCNTPQGLVLDFKDGRTQQQLERMMTPSARAAIREILARMDMVRAKEAAALLQRIAKPVETEDDDSSDAGPDEDDASPIGGEAGKALSALGVATKQKIAEQHSGSEPTSMPPPAPTKPPVLTP